MQLSRPRGFESCNSQVPGVSRVATLKSPGICEMPSGRHCQAPEDLIVEARAVVAQRKSRKNTMKRAKSAETQGPADSDDTRLGFDHPGCNSQVPGDLRVATFKTPGIGELQLSSPRGPESRNSQVPGVLRVATGSPMSGPVYHRWWQNFFKKTT